MDEAAVLDDAPDQARHVRFLLETEKMRVDPGSELLDRGGRRCRRRRLCRRGAAAPTARKSASKARSDAYIFLQRPGAWNNGCSEAAPHGTIAARAALLSAYG